MAKEDLPFYNIPCWGTRNFPIYLIFTITYCKHVFHHCIRTKEEILSKFTSLDEYNVEALSSHHLSQWTCLFMHSSDIMGHFLYVVLDTFKTQWCNH